MSVPTLQARQRIQRRTLGVLTVSQTLGGLGTTVAIAVAAVLAESVSGSEALAGLVQTTQVLGAAAASYLLSRLMGRRGRRIGLMAGYLGGAFGAATCVVAGSLESYPLLLLGAVFLGVNSATTYQSRYAAADLAEPAGRARALATVLWATTFGAVLGPNLVGPAGDLGESLGVPRLTGPFLVTATVLLAATVVLGLFLRPDPLLLAREWAGLAEEDPAAPRTGTGSWARFRALVRVRPAVGAAVLAMSAAHAVMIAVMVMTPLHMDHGGAELQVIGLVISIHVLGMFFFSPVMGVLADRVGRPVVLLGGAVTLLVSVWLAGTSPEGASTRIGVGLFLLGLGWSACTVAASALLTEATPLVDRTAVQGVADVIMNVSAAAAGAVAGVVVQSLGYGALNLGAAVLVLGVLLAAGRARTALAA